MICKKCGRAIKDNETNCPYCGVGLKKENSFNDFKVEEKTSNFSTAKNQTIEDIIEDLEDLKIKDSHQDEKTISRVEMISDEKIEDLLEDMMEYKKRKNQEKVKEEISLINEKSEAINKQEKETYTDNTQKSFDDEIADIDSSTDFDYLNNFNNDNTKDQEENYNTSYNEPKRVHIPFVMEDEKKKKNIVSKTSLILISIITFIFFISLFITYKSSYSPMAKFFKNINDSYSEIDSIIEKINENYDILKGMDLVEISSKSIIQEEIDDNLVSRTVNTRYIEDNKEKKQYFEYNNNEEKFIAFIQNDKLYINQENNSDNFYVTTGKYINLLNLLNKDNINYLEKIIVDELKNELKGKDFKEEKVEEKYNNVNYNLKKISLQLSETRFNNLLIKVLKSIKNDANIVSILEKNSKYTIDEIREYLNKLISSLSDKTNSDTIFNYNIYLDKQNNVVKQTIKYSNKLDINYWNTRQGKNIKLQLNDDVYNIDIKDSYDSILMNITYNTKENLSIQFSKQDDKNIINYQINKSLDSNNNKRKIVNIVSTPKKEKNTYINDILIDVDSNLDNKDIKQTINMTNTITNIDEMPIFDINNSEKIKSMTSDFKDKYTKYFSYFIR